MRSTKRLKNILAAWLLSLITAGNANANEWYVSGVRSVYSARLADALAYCRNAQGDGDDWLNYYLLAFGVNQKTKDLYLSLPQKLRTERAQELIGSTMSCDEMMQKEKEYGVKWFIPNAIDAYIKGFCEVNPKCK